MIGRLINLPFKVIGAVARKVQDRNDAAVRAQHGEGDTSDSYDHLKGKDLASHELPDDYDPGTIDMAAAQLLADHRAHKGMYFLDVRLDDEFVRGHMPGATSIPLGALSIRLAELPPDQRVVVYDADGGRASQRATAFLRFRGIEDCWRLAGGLAAWKAAGGSVVHD